MEYEELLNELKTSYDLADENDLTPQNDSDDDETGTQALIIPSQSTITTKNEDTEDTTLTNNTNKDIDFVKEEQTNIDQKEQKTQYTNKILTTTEKNRKKRKKRKQKEKRSQNNPNNTITSITTTDTNSDTDSDEETQKMDIATTSTPGKTNTNKKKKTNSPHIFINNNKPNQSDTKDHNKFRQTIYTKPIISHTQNSQIEQTQPSYADQLKKTSNTTETSLTSKDKTKSGETKRPIQTVIIDNIKSTKNPTQITNIIKELHKDDITNIRTLKKGGIEITPKTHASLNKIMKTELYPTNIFGTDIYIHMTGVTDLRPWLVINQVPYNNTTEQDTLQHIKQQLTATKTTYTNKLIPIEGLHRKHNISNPTTLILFKTNDEISQQTLLNTKIHINNKIHTIRLYIDKTQTQCTKCKQIGHLKGTCPNKAACGKCSSTTCPVGKCKNTYWKCVNCKGPHASTYKGCTVLKTHINQTFQKRKTETIQKTFIKQTEEKLQNTQTQCNTQIKHINDENTKIQLKLNQEIHDLHEIVNTQKHQINNITQQQGDTNTKHTTKDNMDEITELHKIIEEQKIQIHNMQQNMNEMQKTLLGTIKMHTTESHINNTTITQIQDLLKEHEIQFKSIIDGINALSTTQDESIKANTSFITNSIPKILTETLHKTNTKETLTYEQISDTILTIIKNNKLSQNITNIDNTDSK